jgi:two-component system LytT family sensor kinase
MFSKARIKTILLHTGVWACFISYEVAVAFRMGSKAPPYDFACFYILNICLFYFNGHVGCKWADRKKSVPLFAVVLLSELILYDALSIGMDIFVNSIEDGHLSIEIHGSDHVRSLWRGIYFLGLSTGYYFGLRAYENLQLKRLAERREAAFEMAHLRAQINPHLLFNIANFVYNTVEEVSPKAGESISLLAKSMRYAMAPSQEDGLVKLSEEIEQIERLIQLNQLLSSNRLSIVKEISTECSNENMRIPPLLLLTFIENMFKHGNLIDSPGIISLEAGEHKLHFHTENLKANRRSFSSENIGISNATARLEKYYARNFILESGLNEDTFIVDLKLTL